MAEHEIPYWVALSLTPQVGPQRVRSWLKDYGDLRSLFKSPPSELHSPQDPRVSRHLKWLENPNHHILPLTDPRYPSQLANIASPPLVLYLIGPADLLSQPQMAVVGSRYPSQQGIMNATLFTEALASAGWVITSGMALGIDGVCHQTALAQNKPTIAVLGTGVDLTYPKSHQELATQIAEQGLLVSEFPLGTPPKAAHFPRRNRMISGLSAGVLVVEATTKSGSLITARFAAEQGREVFAIPGSIHNPKARGCHQLLREGAALVETAEDILREVKVWSSSLPSPTIPVKASPVQLDNEQQKLVNCLDDAVTSLDLLVIRSGYSASSVVSVMTQLELEGVVQRAPGGYVRAYDRQFLYN